MNFRSLPATPTTLRQRWFLLGLFLLLLILNVQYLFKVQESRSAFIRWAPQLVDLQDGHDIWRRHNYPNPPIMALLLMPFAQLPPQAGALAWFYFKVLLTVLAIHGVLNLLDQPARPFPLWGKTLVVVLSLRPIQGDLSHGNVNLFILFLVVTALVAFTHRHDLLAGLALALAIACKVTPALFLPYLLWKRAWKMTAATCAGLIFFLIIVPGLSFGWQRNWTYLQSWHHVMVQPFVVEGMVTSEHQNQSLPGLFTRLFTHAPSFATYEGNQYVPLEYHNVLDLDRASVGWLVKGCMALFAGVVLWRCRTPLADRRDWRLMAEYGVVVLGMLLFSERTWKHHAVTLLVPFAVLSYAISGIRLGNRRRGWLIGGLCAASVLMLATSTGFWDAHDTIGKLAQVYGAYVWAYVILAIALFSLVESGPVQISPGAERTATLKRFTQELPLREVTV